MKTDAQKRYDAYRKGRIFTRVQQIHLPPVKKVLTPDQIRERVEWNYKKRARQTAI